MTEKSTDACEVCGECLFVAGEATCGDPDCLERKRRRQAQAEHLLRHAATREAKHAGKSREVNPL